MKTMKSPPAGVKLVMEAICILKGIKPDRIPDPSGSGKKIEDFWGPSKRILGDMAFLKSLKDYDKVYITHSTSGSSGHHISLTSQTQTHKVILAFSHFNHVTHLICMYMYSILYPPSVLYILFFILQDNINPSFIAKIRKEYTSNPEFDPPKIKTASTAAEGLCKWVIAMDRYDKVAKVVAPKKEKLKEAEQKLAVAMKVRMI